MNNKLNRIRHAFLPAMAWGLAWAPFAVLIGLAIDPDGSMDEMWPAIGAYAGFLSGIFFSIGMNVLSKKGQGRYESAVKVSLVGAAAGLLVGLIPLLAGDANPNITPLHSAVIAGTISAFSAGSARVTAWWTQRPSRRTAGA